MHSEATFVYAVTEAAYFTSLSTMNVLPLSRPQSLSQCVPCHRTVIPSIPLCLFMYLPLSVSASLSAPSSPSICLSRSVSLSVWWGKKDCTLLHRKRQRQR